MKVTKTVLQCNSCGAEEARWNSTATVCPWCGEGVMLPMHEEGESDESSEVHGK